MKLLARWLLLPFAALAAGEDFFPLQVGNRWEYTVTLGGNETREITGTETIDGVRWYLLSTSTATGRRSSLLLRKDEAGKLLRLDAQSRKQAIAVDFAARSGDAIALEGFCASSGIVVRADARSNLTQGKEPRLAEGEFGVQYLPNCADAGLLWERYAPGIGLMERSQSSFAGSRTWRLVRARVGGKEYEFSGK